MQSFGGVLGGDDGGDDEDKYRADVICDILSTISDATSVSPSVWVGNEGTNDE